MPRPAQYSRDQILDAAERLLRDGGLQAASVAAIAREVGAPSGSVYHRFPSRDALFTEVWLRATEDLLTGWYAWLSEVDPRAAAIGAARWTVQWAAGRPDAARVLIDHRRQDLVPDPPPEHLADRVSGAVERPHRALHALARRLGAPLSVVSFAVVDLPRAAVARSFDHGEPLPEGVVTAGVAAILDAASGPD